MSNAMGAQHRVSVAFWMNGDKSRLCSAEVMLIDGYTTHDSIPEILAIRYLNSVNATGRIEIKSVVGLDRVEDTRQSMSS